MYWRLLSLTRKDVVGILLAIALLVVIFVAFVGRIYWAHSANWGFGPEWACTNPGQGGPVCVKRGASKADDQTKAAPTIGRVGKTD
jgi:hypothetical protein